MEQTFNAAVKLYDSGLVAAGALIDSSTTFPTGIDTSRMSQVSIIFINNDAGVTRAYQVQMLDANGAAIYPAALGNTGVVAISSLVNFVIAVGAASVGFIAAQTAVWPVPPAPRMRVALTAAGSSTGRVVVWGR